jgi:hypothetical protein
VAPTSLPWRRNDLIARVRRDLWRYLTPSATVEQDILSAAALLQLPAGDVRALGGLQFLTSDEVGMLLERLPSLLRRLATTTAHEEEWSSERIRGAVQWGTTIAVRNATGMRHLYVTHPSRRAYQTPENEMLVFLLDEVVRLGRLSGWRRSTSDFVGSTVSTRVGDAERWMQARPLAQVVRRPLSPQAVSRIRSGRSKRRYGPVIAAYDCHRALVGRLDRAGVRDAVERHGLAAREESVLFELACTFEVLRSLDLLGWKLGRLGLFEGSLRLTGHRGSETIEVFYQQAPVALTAGSVYRSAQKRHQIQAGGLRPDLVIRRVDGAGAEAWLLVEVKGGHRAVEKSARAATFDLMAYGTAFAKALSGASSGYGLGIAWGEGIRPNSDGPITLCTPELIAEALAVTVG